jgi:hypothetical protein
MASRVVRPETKILHISQGDWLLVKKRLNHGEQRAAFTRTIKAMDMGSGLQLDPSQLGVTKVVAYLLDWSLVDLDGKSIVIRDQPFDVVASALNSLESESVVEILAAITAHETEQDKELAE